MQLGKEMLNRLGIIWINNLLPVNKEIQDEAYYRGGNEQQTNGFLSNTQNSYLIHNDEPTAITAH